MLVADSVMINFWEIGFKQVISFYLEAAEMANLFMMDFVISCTMQAFIWSITVDGEVSYLIWIFLVEDIEILI